MALRILVYRSISRCLLSGVDNLIYSFPWYVRLRSRASSRPGIYKSLTGFFFGGYGGNIQLFWCVNVVFVRVYLCFSVKCGWYFVDNIFVGMLDLC